MARNYKPSSIWQHRITTICFTRVNPLAYYMEEKMTSVALQKVLEDATVAEFEKLFKNYHTNFFKNSNAIVKYYLDNARQSKFPLLFNDDFFTLFKTEKYYSKAESFQNLSSFLVKDFYANEIEYNKAVKYLESNLTNKLINGRQFISFDYASNA
jgi:hypothetical protein